MRKGQSEIVENIFTIFFSIIFLSAILILSYSIYTNQLKIEIENNLRQIGMGISENILKLYEVGKNSDSYPDENESVKIAEIDLKLPSKVSGRNYEILVTTTPIFIQISNVSVDGSPAIALGVSLHNQKILLRTTQSPEVSVEVDIPNIDVPVQGKCENGLNGLLSYYRQNFDGTLKDIILLGRQDIIIDVNEVS
jgi:hypothetical protein